MLTRLQCSEISFSLHWDRLWRRQSAIDRFPLKSVPKKKKFIMVETSLKIKESMMGALRHVNIVLPVRWAYSPTSKNLWICLTDVLPTKMKVTTTKHDSQRTSQWQRKTHLEQPKTLGPRDNTQLEWQKQWHVSRLLSTNNDDDWMKLMVSRACVKFEVIWYYCHRLTAKLLCPHHPHYHDFLFHTCWSDWLALPSTVPSKH